MNLRSSTLLVASAALFACSSNPATETDSSVASSGSGGGGGSAPLPFSKTKIASASVGEVLEVTADTEKRTYSWTTLKSSYVDLDTASPAAYSGTGTLTEESAQSPRFLMTDDATKAVMGTLSVADNGTLIARLAIPAINGENRAFPDANLMFGSGPLKNLVSVPVLGVTNATSKASELAGTYNFIALGCSGKSKGFFNQTKTFELWNDSTNTNADALCTTEYGTMKVVASSSFEDTVTVQYCFRDDLGAKKDAANCLHDHGEGEAKYNAAKGVWSLVIGAEGFEHSLVAFQSTGSGQRVGWVDTDGGLLGYGQLVLAEQLPVVPSSTNGTYAAESSGFNSATRTLCGDDAAGLIQLGSWGKVTVNVPWTGLSTIGIDPTGEAIGMMSGTGVFIYRNPNDDPWALEIGTRVNSGGCD